MRNYSFVPLDLSFWSLFSIGLHVVSDQPVFLFSADTNGWREIASLSRTLGKLERFAIIDFPPFFSPFLLSFFPVPATYRCIFFSRFFLFPLFPSFFPYPTLFAFCTLFSRTHVRSTVCTLWKEIVGLKLTVHRASTSARTCLFPSTCLRISDVLLGAIDFLFFLQREVINCRVFGFLSSFFCFSSLSLVEVK